MRLFAALLLMLLTLLSPAVSAAGESGGDAPAKAALTVMPFTALEQGGQAWLGKAVADLVAQKLASSGVEVLERDKLEALLKEMELQQAGFADPAAVKRLGGLARVDRVVYGNYTLNGNSIALHLLVMDIKTQDIAEQAEAEGPADDLPAVTSALVMNLLKKQGKSLSDAELKNINFRATDSTPALEHFYKGIDDVDRGKDEDAYGEFTAAARQDPKYLDARLWSGRMLEAQGMSEQAALTYTKLHEDAPNVVEGRDALFFAAKLSEQSAPEAAVADYRLLAALRPRIPEGLEADLRLSKVLAARKKYGEAYAALQDIQDFRSDADKLLLTMAGAEYHEERGRFFDVIHSVLHLLHDNRDDLSADNDKLMAGLVDQQMRQSRFFGWGRALQLYRGATIEMIGLLREALKEKPDLKAPRGVFVVDPLHPEIAEAHYGDTKSLFFEDEKTVPGWGEKFYAAVVPEGYTAEGVTLEVSGMLPSPTATTDFTLRVFSFPLAKNYYNGWLGTIYGQTPQMTTLDKDIAFHGQDHDILVFQLIENNSHIRDWKVSFRLKAEKPGEKQAAAAPPDNTPPTLPPRGDFEGVEAARLSLDEDLSAGVADPQYIEQFASKKRLALLSTGKGSWLVVARGSLHTGGGANLWGAYSADGRTWPRLQPLGINSQSSDFAPQLVRGEDGAARLFWISNRRGLGWELWTSMAKPGGGDWSEPQRLPIEKFLHYSPLDAANIADDLLEYAAIQDKQGRWLVAVCQTGAEGGAVILSSGDAQTWEKAGAAENQRRYFDAAFLQDAGGAYWLGAIDGGAEFHLLRSVDLKTWATHDYALGSYAHHWSTPGNANYSSVSEIAGFPQQLFDSGDGRLVLLFSDALTGLQSALFNPETAEPAPDLVRDISLEPYAAARSPGGGWLVAAWQGDDIVLRRYRHFAFPDNPRNAAEDPLYRETESDAAGNKWDRRIARTRYVVSDVTAVGATPGGRAWWGVETGAMSLKGNAFFVADVSMGFFFHQVTDIVPCGDKTWFSSRMLSEPLLGALNSDKPSEQTEKVPLPGMAGAVTALSCEAGTLYIATSSGDVASLAGGEVTLIDHLVNSVPTAIAKEGDDIWVGTQAGLLVRLGGKKGATVDFQKEGSAAPVAGIAASEDGTLWVATAGSGIFRLKSGAWTQYTPQNSPFPYLSPGKLKADGNGVWFMPGLYETSRGIGYFDGAAASLYNPPSRNLFDIIDFDRAPDGSLWIGSESSGIYRFERKK